jgi:hypothetical protein
MFSFYWKEIAIVLAGVFAILGAISDVRDKRTKKITVWGRVFFTLTILSVIAGVYAQWTESAADEVRIKQAQADMLSVLQRTEKSIYELSRVLQPLDQLSVRLGLSPNCDDQRFKVFCEAAKSRGRAIVVPSSNSDVKTAFEITTVDWSAWPGARPLGSFWLQFFKDPNQAQQVLQGPSQAQHLTQPDLSLNLRDSPEHNATLKVIYQAPPETITFVISQSSLTPSVTTDRILSVVDIPGSTMTVSEPNGVLDNVTLTGVYLTTSHGQWISAGPMQPLNSRNGRLFVYRFPPK